MIYDRILITKEEIDARLDELAKDIVSKYGKFDNVVLLVVLNGARHFADDLTKRIDADIEAAYICASSYHGKLQSSGEVIISSKISSELKGKRVIIVDDVYDSGLTLDAVLRFVMKQHPESIKTCVLLEKSKLHKINVKINFRGFFIEDFFLVGYGLDYKGQCRDLPFIASVEPKNILAISKPKIGKRTNKAQKSGTLR